MHTLNIILPILAALEEGSRQPPMWYSILLTVPPLLIAVMLHEIAHGYVAGRLGDPTAKQKGRLTLNPLKHIDPFMTIILPAILIASHSPIIFGGAKPVPVNPMYFKNPRRGMLWVAAAGPATNLVLAGISYGLLRVLGLALSGFQTLELSETAIEAVRLAGGWLSYSIIINIVLGVFNLIPVPPLDGGRIMVGILPLPLARRLAKIEPFGIYLVIIVIYLLSKYGIL
jgi:Zn-dependent protease